jgi:hypothetical protein
LKLIKAVKDIAYNTIPLRGVEAYYSTDRKYKVILSNPVGQNLIITIGYNPLTETPPPDEVCNDILKTLGITKAEKQIFPKGFGEPGIARYIEFN